MPVGRCIGRGAVRGAGAAAPDDWSELQLEVQLQFSLDDAPGVPRARLRCALPPGYPESSAAVVSVSVEGLTRAASDRLSAALSDKAGGLVGSEAVMELVQELQELAHSVVSEGDAAAAAAGAACSSRRKQAAPPPPPPPPPPPCFGRRWIHAQTVTKPPNRSWACGIANELNLGGYLKPGHPGIFVFEGEGQNCDEYISTLKTKCPSNSCLKSLAVRGAVNVDLELPPGELGSAAAVAAAVDALRQLPARFEDLNVTDMVSQK
eukprot:SAG22_NODE_19_length_32182_cov_39.206963_1_plen_264_part_00